MSVRRRLQDNRGEPDIVTPLLPMASPVGVILNSITRVIGGAQEVSEHVREARDTRDGGKPSSPLDSVGCSQSNTWVCIAG